jgi:tetratricopeptide (TPR) repeat protein
VDLSKTYQLDSNALKQKIKLLKLTNTRLRDIILQNFNKDINIRTLSRWRNHDSNITEENLVLLAQALDCNPEEIIKDIEPKPIEHKPLVSNSLAKSKYIGAVKELSQVSKARDFVTKGDLDMGITMMNTALMLPLEKSEKLKLYAYSAFLNMMNGDLRAADGYCQNILADDETNINTIEAKYRALRVLSWVSIFRGKFDIAEDMINKTFQLIPDLKGSLKEAEYETIGLQGVINLCQGDFISAKNKIIIEANQSKLNTSAADSITSLVVNEFYLAYTLIELEDIEQARLIVVYLKSLIKFKYYSRGHRFFALESLMLAYDGRFSEADKLCQKAVENYPKTDPLFIIYEIAAKVYRMTNNEKLLSDIVETSVKKFKGRTCLGGIYKEYGLFYLNNSDRDNASIYLYRAREQYKLAAAIPRYQHLSKFLQDNNIFAPQT